LATIYMHYSVGVHPA